jgi:DNA-binding transcriptional LysR family regulator
MAAAPLDLEQLQTFIAISDTGSFTKAPEEIFRTQSAVSMQMRRLEERIGKPLFEKDGRTNRLTEEGERLLSYARRLLRLNRETLAAFDDGRLEGHIRIGTPDDYADRFLPEILARFARTHPLVTIDVDCLGSGELFSRVKRSEIDLALVTHGCDIITDEPVRREQLVWVTSMRHCAHMAEILPLAVSHAGCEWRSKVLKSLEKQKRKYRVAYSTPNSNAVNAAVMQGLAVGAMPELCVRPGMRILTEKDGFPGLGSFDIGLVRKPGKANKAIEALARHVSESLANYQPQMVAAE